MISIHPQLTPWSPGNMVFFMLSLNESDPVPTNYPDLIFEATLGVFIRFFLVFPVLSYFESVVKCQPRLYF